MRRHLPRLCRNPPESPLRAISRARPRNRPSRRFSTLRYPSFQFRASIQHRTRNDASQKPLPPGQKVTSLLIWASSLTIPTTDASVDYPMHIAIRAKASPKQRPRARVSPPKISRSPLSDLTSVTNSLANSRTGRKTQETKTNAKLRVLGIAPGARIIGRAASGCSRDAPANSPAAGACASAGSIKSAKLASISIRVHNQQQRVRAETRQYGCNDRRLDSCSSCSHTHRVYSIPRTALSTCTKCSVRIRSAVGYCKHLRVTPATRIMTIPTVRIYLLGTCLIGSLRCAGIGVHDVVGWFR